MFAKIMTKQFYIVFLIVLGFVLNPAISFACGSGSQEVEMACCTSEGSTTMDCCSKDVVGDTHQGEGCGDSCSSASCQCPTFSITSQLIISNVGNILYPTYHSNSFFYENALTSTGFTRIWLPPKIA